MDAREVIRLIIGILTAALICVIAAESSGQRSGRIQVASGQWVCKLIQAGKSGRIQVRMPERAARHRMWPHGAKPIQNVSEVDT